MSIALICDRCGDTFAEGEEGSTSGTVTANVRGDNGRMYPEQRRFDQCGVCSVGPKSRAAIESTASNAG